MHPQLAHLAAQLDQSREVPVLPEDIGAPKPRRASAVALLLRPRDGASHGADLAVPQLELLLIRRAEREGDVWSGQVGLPGGRAEATDRDIVHTAARETMEEVSVDLDAPAAHLLGGLPMLVPRFPGAPRLTVHPFVWSVGAGVDPVPNEEVAALRWVSLEYLSSADNRIEHRLMDPAGVEQSFPAVTLGEDVLWGLTHRIVETLLEALGIA